MGQQDSLVNISLMRDVSPEQLSEFAFVEGHKRVRFFARAFGPDWARNGVTMLRDPVSRTVSQARNIRLGTETTKYHDVLRAEVRDPDDVIDRVPVLSNLQTWYLGDSLDEAMEVLETLTFGVTNRFDASLALIGSRFGLDSPHTQVAHRLPDRGDEDLRGEEFRAAVRRRNELDEKLYRYAAELFDRRVDRYATCLLSMSLDDAPLACRLKSEGRWSTEVVTVPADSTRATLSGWALLDGRAADAVLVRVVTQATPLLARLPSLHAERHGRSITAHLAGVAGTIEIPAEATHLDVIGFDRRRGRRGERRFTIERPRSSKATHRRARRP